MDAPFKAGVTVRQKVVVIEGVVQDLEFDKGTGKFRYLVDYSDADGVLHARWFSHDEITEVAAAEAGQGKQESAA